MTKRKAEISKKRIRKKTGSYLYEINGKKVSKADYWGAKLEIAIEDAQDFFLNIRITPNESVELLHLMTLFHAKDPSEVVKRCLKDANKIMNPKDSQIEILMSLYDCQTPAELHLFLMKKAYADVQLEILKQQEKKDSLQNRKPG